MSTHEIRLHGVNVFDDRQRLGKNVTSFICRYNYFRVTHIELEEAWPGLKLVTPKGVYILRSYTAKGYGDRVVKYYRGRCDGYQVEVCLRKVSGTLTYDLTDHEEE